MDNKVDTGSCTEIIFESYSSTVHSSRKLAPFFLQKANAENSAYSKLLGSLINVYFYIFLHGQVRDFASIRILSSFFGKTPGILP